MKDLDFDELDRAVNSLMSDVSKADTSTSEQKEKTLDLTSTTASAAGAPPKEAPTTAPIQAPAPVATPSPKVTTPSAPLATRRGGRFMDVVHPSSNMKKQDQARPTSRQGITVAPRETFDAAPDLTSAAASVPAVPPAVDQPKPQATVDEHPAAVSEWPDPLEMADFKKQVSTPETSVAPEPDPAPLETPLVPPSPDTESTTPDRPPLESPFLPDTKVEKRPLGAGTLSTDEPDRAPLLTADIEKTVSDPNDQLPAVPKDVEPILPEELHHELVAIESDANTMHTDDEVSNVSEPLSEREKEENNSKKENRVKLPVVESDDTSVPSGPTSIPQQYREEPSTGDKENGAIYDTDSYHQPLAHPAKKKSGWLWVVWIVLILLVGGGAGAALYFLGII